MCPVPRIARVEIVQNSILFHTIGARSKCHALKYRANAMWKRMRAEKMAKQQKFPRRNRAIDCERKAAHAENNENSMPMESIEI